MTGQKESKRFISEGAGKSCIGVDVVEWVVVNSGSTHVDGPRRK